jgi:hypothetical protein
MKKNLKIYLSIAFMALLSLATMAQPMDPGDPPGGPGGGGGDPIGGGAPIGGGIYILIAMALAYGISRWYAIHNQKTVQD